MGLRRLARLDDLVDVHVEHGSRAHGGGRFATAPSATAPGQLDRLGQSWPWLRGEHLYTAPVLVLAAIAALGAAAAAVTASVAASMRPAPRLIPVRVRAVVR